MLVTWAGELTTYRAENASMWAALQAKRQFLCAKNSFLSKDLSEVLPGFSPCHSADSAWRCSKESSFNLINSQWVSLPTHPRGTTSPVLQINFRFILGEEIRRKYMTFHMEIPGKVLHFSAIPCQIRTARGEQCQPGGREQLPLSLGTRKWSFSQESPNIGINPKLYHHAHRPLPLPSLSHR